METNTELRRKLYNVYNHINYRCNNCNSEHFDRYGGRGIKNLFKDFDEFFNSMSDTYIDHVNEYGFENTTIERIDNDGNYSMKNTIWATRKEQATNRVTTIYFKVINILDSTEYIFNNIKEFCSRCSYNEATIGNAIKNYGIFSIYKFELINVEDYNDEEIGLLHQRIRVDSSKELVVEVYRAYNNGLSVIDDNLKRLCRKLNIDASAAYKVVKGTRKTCGGYKIVKEYKKV